MKQGTVILKSLLQRADFTFICLSAERHKPNAKRGSFLIPLWRTDLRDRLHTTAHPALRVSAYPLETEADFDVSSTSLLRTCFSSLSYRNLFVARVCCTLTSKVVKSSSLDLAGSPPASTSESGVVAYPLDVGTLSF